MQHDVKYVKYDYKTEQSGIGDLSVNLNGSEL